MASDPLLIETERFLHAQIPLTNAMQVHVASFDEARLVLTAPLEANHNHLGTAFGGSLATLATLAGYSMLWLLLEDREAHIVIKDSKIRYLAPVRGELRAACQRPSAGAVTKFKKLFAKSDKARITLKAVVEEGDRVCVEFEGTFVALR